MSMTLVDMACITLRVMCCCCVFAFFLFFSFKSRLRLGYWRSAALFLFDITVTAAVTILFLVPGSPLREYNVYGICLWLLVSVVVFRLVIKGSAFEILFIVLVTLNLYVNIVAIAKVIGNLLNLDSAAETTKMVLVLAVLAAYTPLLWLLMAKLYKQVIDFRMSLSFWNYIWIIPALTYLIFYVKIVNDYWITGVHTGPGDVVFVILWSFATYAFFYVTLQMLIQAYKGITAVQQAETVSAQLTLQKEQYGKLLESIEKTSRLKHDWRHHLLSINGFVEAEDIKGLKEYVKELIPEYIEGKEISICRNHIADVILRHYAAAAEAAGIRLDISAELSEIPDVSDMDLCIIFGNLLENALEACGGMEDGTGYVEIQAEMRGKQLVLQIQNTYQRDVILKEGRYYSTKHSGVGIGLSSVEKVVDKYHGIMRVSFDGIIFKVQILLF